MVLASTSPYAEMETKKIITRSAIHIHQVISKGNSGFLMYLLIWLKYIFKIELKVYVRKLFSRTIKFKQEKDNFYEQKNSKDRYSFVRWIIQMLA